MGGHQQQPSLFVNQPLDPFGVDVPGIATPIVFIDQPGREKDIDRQHDKVLEAPPARPPNPLLAFFGKARSKIIQRPLSSAMIMFPEQSTEKARRFKIGLDIEQVQKYHENA